MVPTSSVKVDKLEEVDLMTVELVAQTLAVDVDTLEDVYTGIVELAKDESDTEEMPTVLVVEVVS